MHTSLYALELDHLTGVSLLLVACGQVMSFLDFHNEAVGWWISLPGLAGKGGAV